MEIAKLLVYPIKSLRAIELDNAQLTDLGFPHDRQFMLLEVLQQDNGSIQYKNMHVTYYHKMVLFFPELIADGGASSPNMVSIKYRPLQGAERSIEIPLEPDTDGLEVIEVVMHKSPTQAYIMEQRVNEWFSSCFGINVVLAYLGDNLRPVRMSYSSTSSTRKSPIEQPATSGGGWFGSMSNVTATAKSFFLSEKVTEAAPPQQAQITFADCAPYLVVSERSMDDLHTRLPEGEQMDITKFRPNIIVSGAAEPWEEDFWSELTITGSGTTAQVACVQNCGRCQSINVDYATGALGTTAAGSMLKKMMRDRRVDPGMKYSPIFGRYAFLQPGSHGQIIRKGDRVDVSRRNLERTIFDWDGLATT